MKDYYYILGAEKDAPIKDIKRCYIRLSNKLHPDKNNGDAFFDARFKELQEAYETLSDETRRQNYDVALAQFTGKSNHTQSTQSQTQQTKHQHSGKHTAYETPKPIFIRQFSSSQNCVRKGDEITITWHVDHADAVKISCFNDVLPRKGRKNIRFKRIINKQIRLVMVAESVQVGCAVSELILKSKTSRPKKSLFMLTLALVILLYWNFFLF